MIRLNIDFLIFFGKKYFVKIFIMLEIFFLVPPNFLWNKYFCIVFINESKYIIKNENVSEVFGVFGQNTEIF